jgi:uncharacterized protein YuzE
MGETVKLKIDYCKDTDTLSLWNGEPASHADDVADNLTADYDSRGDAVGFTLENAAELLLPILAAAKESTKTKLSNQAD